MIDSFHSGMASGIWAFGAVTGFSIAVASIIFILFLIIGVWDAVFYKGKA